MKAEVRMTKAKWETVALGDFVEPAQTWNPSRSPSDEVFDLRVIESKFDGGYLFH